MAKRAQGISLNIVVTAAILLLVLIVLSVTYTGKIGVFSVNIGRCESQGGSCSDENVCEIKAPERHDSCDTPLKSTDTGGVHISLAGKSVCCLKVK